MDEELESLIAEAEAKGLLDEETKGLIAEYRASQNATVAPASDVSRETPLGGPQTPAGPPGPHPAFREYDRPATALGTPAFGEILGRSDLGARLPEAAATLAFSPLEGIGQAATIFDNITGRPVRALALSTLPVPPGQEGRSPWERAGEMGEKKGVSWALASNAPPGFEGPAAVGGAAVDVAADVMMLAAPFRAAGKMSRGLAGAYDRALAAPSRFRNAADELLRVTVSEPIIGGAKEAGQAIVKEMDLPDGLKQWLGRALLTEPEIAGAAVAEEVTALRKAENLVEAESLGQRIQLDNAMKKAGIAPDSEAEMAVNRYIGGEEVPLPPEATPELAAVADQSKAYIGGLLDEGVELGVVSTANRKEHLKGLLTRTYRNLPEKEVTGRGTSRFGVHDIFMRDDAEGLIVRAPMADVLEKLSRIPAVEAKASPPPVGAAPPVVEPMVTLYRYEPEGAGAGLPDWIKANERVPGTIEAGNKEASGRWFSASPDDFYKKQIEDAGRKPRLVTREVPAKDVEQFRVSNLPPGHPARGYSRRPDEEFFLPPGESRVAVEPAGALSGVVDVPTSPLPAINPDALTYLHEINGSTGIKIGKGPEAARITDALAAQFPKDQILRRVVEKPLDQRIAMGEDFNPGANVERTAASIGARNAMARFFNNLADRVAYTFPDGRLKPKVGDLIPPGHQTLPDDLKYGKMAGRVVPNEVAEFIKRRNPDSDAFMEGLAGTMDAIKTSLAVTPKGVVANPVVNFTIYSLGMGNNPVLNPESIQDWVRFLRDAYEYGTTGKMTPEFRLAIGSGGVQSHSVLKNMVGEMDEAMALMSGYEQKKVSPRDLMRRLTYLLGASPHMEEAALTRGAVGAVSGALPEVIRGAGPAEIAGAAAKGAGVSFAMGGRRAKLMREGFGLADPVYQGAGFYTNFRKFKNRGLSEADAATKAGEEVRKWSQQFGKDDIPHSVNIAAGRTPPDIGGKPSRIAQAFAKVGSVTFPGFIYNHAKIMGQMALEKPASLLPAALGAYIIGESMWDSAGADLGWSREETERAKNQAPGMMPVTYESKDGTKKMMLVDRQRFAPGMEVLSNPAADLPFVGVLPGLASRASAVLGAERGGDVNVPDPRTGFPILRGGQEKANPLSAIPGIVQNALGGGYGPLGSSTQEVFAGVEGREDAFGRKANITDAILSTVAGLRARSYEVEGRGSLESAAKGIKRMTLTEAKKRMDAVLRDPNATEEQKDRAKRRFREEKDELERKSKEGLPIMGR